MVKENGISASWWVQRFFWFSNIFKYFNVVGRWKHFDSVSSMMRKRQFLDSNIHLLTQKTGQYDQEEKSIFQISLLVGMFICLTSHVHENVRYNFRKVSIHEKNSNIFVCLSISPIACLKARCNHWRLL